MSPDALIIMKSAGVAPDVIEAVVKAASSKSQSPSVAPSSSLPAETAPAAPGSQSWPPSPQAAKQKSSASPTIAVTSAQPSSANPSTESKEPSVVLLPASAPIGSAAPKAGIALSLEKTQLAQTKTRASSLGGLAGDSVTTQALESGANTAAWEAATHSGGSMGGEIAAGQAGGILGSVMSRRKSTVTYLWAVPGPNSPTLATSNQPRFSVNFSEWMYVNLDQFEPVIVKLTPTPNLWRLVGASRGKENAFSSSAVDWQAFSNFLQDPAPTEVKRISPGIFEVSAAKPLEPGQYGIVLRPISKTMKFSGADVARNQGNGKVFNSVWSFEVK